MLDLILLSSLLLFAPASGSPFTIHHPASLHPSTHNSSSPNTLSLAQNVQNLISSLHSSPDPILRTSPLVALYATARPFQFTQDLASFTDLELNFWPSNVPTRGPLTEIYIFRNNPPPHWDRWQAPERQLIDHYTDQPMREIQWAEVQAIMGLEEAWELLGGEGWTGGVGMVVLSVWMRYPLSWCFKFDGAVNVRVDVVTREVVEEVTGC
ncbi:MAG: hypothetical protein Q9170_005576 [Blastenia crenularia]